MRTHNSTTTGESVTFGELWVGDRFAVHGSLWTRLSPSTARKHGNESVALGQRGYGYIGDTICSFEADDVVEFVAPRKAMNKAAKFKGRK